MSGVPPSVSPLYRYSQAVEDAGKTFGAFLADCPILTAREKSGCEIVADVLETQAEALRLPIAGQS